MTPAAQPSVALLVLDKLIIALIVAAASAAVAYWLNRKLEAWKQNLALAVEQWKIELVFSGELNRKKFDRLAEIWEHLYALADELGLILDEIVAQKVDHRPARDGFELFVEEHKGRRATFQKLFRQSRFWMAPHQEREIEAYLQNVDDLLRAFADQLEGIEELRKRLKTVRQNVDSIRASVFTPPPYAATTRTRST